MTFHLELFHCYLFFFLIIYKLLLFKSQPVKLALKTIIFPMTDIIQILTNLEVNIDKYEFEAFNISLGQRPREILKTENTNIFNIDRKISHYLFYYTFVSIDRKISQYLFYYTLVRIDRKISQYLFYYTFIRLSDLYLLN